MRLTGNHGKATIMPLSKIDEQKSSDKAGEKKSICSHDLSPLRLSEKERGS